MLRYKSILSILILSFMMMSTNVNAQSDFNQIRGYSLLWEITGNDLEKPSYLFGTMHVRDKRAFEFPDSVLIALDKCEAMATEVHFDSLYSELYADKVEEEIILKFYDLDEKSSDFNFADSDDVRYVSHDEKPSFHLSRKDVTTNRFKQLEGLLNFGKEEDLKDVFLDAYLFRRAKNLNKNLFGLEKIVDPLEHLNKITISDSILIQNDSIPVLDSLYDDGLPDLKEFIKNKGETLELLTNIYQKGNISKVDEFINLFYGKESKKEWLLDRNEDMLRSMKRIMPKQSLFAAVGCAHLPGKGGLLQLLEQNGYKVRRVIPNNTGVAAERMSQKLEDKWETYVNTPSGFQVDVPFTPQDIDMMAGVKLHMVNDMVKQEYYVFYGLPCAFAGIDPADPNKYKIVTDRMKEQGEIQNVSSKKLIKHNGHEGFEMAVDFGKKWEENRGFLRLFTMNQFLYVFLVKTENDEISNRFFDSIKFAEPEVKEEESAFRNETEAGFSATMPGMYQKQVLLLPQDQATPEFKVRMSQYVATDIGTNSVTAIFKSDLAPGQYFDNDSTSIEFMLGQFDEKIKYGDKHGDIIIMENGISGFQPDRIIKDGSTSIAMRSFIRGPSIYYMYYQTLESKFSIEGANAFFNSITFLPFANDNLELKKLKEINVLLANEPLSNSTYDYYGSYEFNGNDYFPKSNISVCILKEPISKYVKIESIDSVFTNYPKERLADLEKVVEKEVKTNSQGDQYLDMLIETKHTSMLERRIVYYKNAANYTISYFISPELKTSSWLDKIVKQTTIEDVEYTKNANERHQSFFDDLLSGKEETIEELRYVIYQMEFKESDVNQIKKVLETSFDFKEEKHTHWVHSDMLESLVEIKTEAAINVIRHYFETANTGENRMSAFVKLKENNWSDLKLKDLIESNTTIDGMYYQYNTLFEQELKDSLKQFIEDVPFYSKHYQLEKDERNSLLYSIKENKDTLVLNGFIIDSMNIDLKYYINNALDTIKYHDNEKTQDHYNWQETNTLDYAILIAENVEDEELKKIILDIPYIENEFEPIAYLEYRALQGVAIEKKEWVYMDTYNYGFYNLINTLIKKGKKDAVPDHFLSDEKISEITFRSIMSDDWGDVIVEKSLGIKTIKRDDEEKEVIFFVFKEKGESKEKYIGYVEKVSVDNMEKKSIWDYIYKYDYNDVEENDYDNIVNKMIKGE